MKRTLILVLLLFVCAVPSMLEAAPNVYPVKRVFGFWKNTLEKAPAFQKWVSSRSTTNEMRDARTVIVKEFDAEFRKVFGPLAADNITDVNKHEVLVASLHLLRASEYTVPKLGFAEVSMPITLSIVITNPSTGEVIYSFTKTSYATTRVVKTIADNQEQIRNIIEQDDSGQEQTQKITDKSENDEEQEQMFVDARPIDQEQAQMMADSGANYRSLVSTLIKEAKAEYNPASIEISVVDTWKGLYILDKGSKFGIVKDENITDASGNELTVKYLTEDYAVAISLLGKIDRNKKFFKYTTASTANQFNKPRVLTMHEGWRELTLKGIAYVFDSEISKESAFTLLPVSEHFTRLLAAVAQDTAAGKFETTNQRTLPDYLIKFTATKPRWYTISKKGKFSQNVYEQNVVGELLDRQGRMLFSAVGTDRIEDQNVAGMVFAKKDRLEVLLKNATVNLAEQFSRSIKFSRFMLPVTNVTGKIIEINDISKDLRIGQEVTVYRNIGKVSGITTDVIIPLWQANVVDVQNDKTKLDLVIKLTETEVDISNDDMVIIDAMSTSSTANQSNTSVKYCSHIDPKLGHNAITIDDFTVISKAYGYLMPYTLYDQDDAFIEKIRKAANRGGFKDSLRLDKIDTAGRCVLPVYRASRGEIGSETQISCDDEGNCLDKIELAVGFRLYINNERNKGGTASKTTVTINGCRKDVCEQVMQGALSKTIHELLKTNIIKLNYK